MNNPYSAKHKKAEFANTVDPNEPSHLDLQYWPSSPLLFNIIQFELKVFGNFADVILSSAFLVLFEIKMFTCASCSLLMSGIHR